MEMGFIPGKKLEIIKNGFSSIVRLGDAKYGIRPGKWEIICEA
jgi:Fe2+ transport system protein FeoA